MRYYNGSAWSNAALTLTNDASPRVGININDPTTINYNLEINGTAGKNDGSTLWTNASDARLKDVLGASPRGLQDVLKLRPVAYRYKKDNARGLPSHKEHVGFLAQEVMQVYPETVSKGDDGYYDFDMHPINVSLIRAVQELQAEIDALKLQYAQDLAKLRSELPQECRPPSQTIYFIKTPP